MFVLSRVDDGREYEDAIRALVKHEDTHFHPPLSTRTDTIDRNLSEDETDGAIDDFVRSILDEPTVLAHDEETGELAGLLSYREHYTNDALLAYQPAHHLSVVIVHDHYTDTELYKALIAETIDLFKTTEDIEFLTTRLSESSIERRKVLEHTLGFTCVNRVRNDRPDNVDTMWFAYHFE